MTQELPSGDVELRPIAPYDTHDPRTGLLNKVGFEDTYDSWAARAESGLCHFWVLYADLNGLKEVNDNPKLGHEVGDALIATAAVALCEYIRLPDIVSRSYQKGDEFLALLEIPSGFGDPNDLYRQRLASLRDVVPMRFFALLDGHSGLGPGYSKVLQQEAGVAMSMGGVLWRPDASSRDMVTAAEFAMRVHKIRHRLGQLALVPEEQHAELKNAFILWQIAQTSMKRLLGGRSPERFFAGDWANNLPDAVTDHGMARMIDEARNVAALCAAITAQDDLAAVLQTMVDI